MPKSQKPIICINGSRIINNINLDRWLDSKAIGCVCAGGAAGVDTLAEKWARKHKLEFVEFPAKWERYGKKAGMIRNEEMINFCDGLMSFWDGKSSGTFHVIQYANKIGVPVQIHLIQELD